MVAGKVVIILGSEKDMAVAEAIIKPLQAMKLTHEIRVLSAHKVTGELLDAIKAYGNKVVYITVAGRSNALSGVVDANSPCPVIACPNLGSVAEDIYSSLRMPSGVAPLVVLEPENAAIAAAKIIGLANPTVAAAVEAYQHGHRSRVLESDRKIKHGNI